MILVNTKIIFIAGLLAGYACRHQQQPHGKGVCFMDYFLTEEQQMIKELAARIADEKIAPVAIQYDEEGIFPHDIVKVLADSDLCGVYIPEEYGGLGGGVFYDPDVYNVNPEAAAEFDKSFPYKEKKVTETQL